MKTSALIGPALDWAVAQCEFEGCEDWDGTLDGVDCVSDMQGEVYAPSTHWSQGGPIIERECIATYASGACSVAPKNPDYWIAEILGTEWMITQYGPTPLIAAMRCYVASKIGNEINIPEELS